jgi:hypothetical protein
MNPTAQPKSKASQIIDELNKMLDNRTINEVALKRFKVEAERIKEKDLAKAFSILGMIACIENDLQNMHSYHKNAITYSNENIAELSHYVVSLMNRRLFKDVHIYAQKVYKKSPSNSKNLDILIRAVNELNLEEEFQKYIKKWENLVEEPHILVAFPEDNDDNLFQMLDNFDKLINNQPDLVLKPDPKLIELADNLVEGVEVN